MLEVTAKNITINKIKPIYITTI